MFVKVCGITNEDDALLAVAMGADALGFVFAPSRRQVNVEHARDIVRRLPAEAIGVGVFVDERPERIVEICNRVGLRGAQLHGRETMADVRYVRERVRFVIQAYKAGDPALSLAANSPADIVLVDGPNPGSGKVFDWSLAERVPPGVRLLLAGGLNHQNVADAIATLRPWGVDVSSGVERSAGQKDPTKVRLFVQAAKDAGERLAALGQGTRHRTMDLGVAPDEIPIDELPEVVPGRSRPYDWSLDGA
jgi:phosphoribosylanthranilate isomerase